MCFFHSLVWSFQFGAIHWLAPNGEALATWLLFITGLVAIPFAFRQLSQQRDIARVENLCKLVEIFDGPNYVLTRWKTAKIRLDQFGDSLNTVEDKHEIPDTAYRLLDFFEHVARLVNQKYIDEEGAWSEFYEWILMYGIDFNPLIDAERLNRSDKTYYANFTDLRTKLECINKRKAGVTPPPTRDDLRDFYEMEQNALEDLHGCKDYRRVH
jgi:hypothetical protein